jgi:hypothetical protein
VARGPVGLWRHEEERLTEVVLARANERFEAARSGGRSLSLDEAVEYALGED